MIINRRNVGAYFNGECLKCKKAPVFLDTDGFGRFWAQCSDRIGCNHSVILEEPESELAQQRRRK